MRSDFQGDFTASDASAPGVLSFERSRTVPVVRFRDNPMQKPAAGMTAKKLILTAALVACASPALAGSSVSAWNCRHSRYYGYSDCRTTWTDLPDPVRNVEQERLEAIARQKEDAKWEAFCRPTFRADEYGVRRASYARQGCEFGRTE
jgi:hypothetical protein